MTKQELGMDPGFNLVPEVRIAPGEFPLELAELATATIFHEAEEEKMGDAVIHLTGFGIGVVEPTNEYTDDEVLRESERTQKPVEDATIVCIDERFAADGKHEPVRRKTVAGPAMSGMMGDFYSDDPELAVAFAAKGGIYQESVANQVFEFEVDIQLQAGIKQGAHTDNHVDPKTGKTHCGGMDAAEAGNKAVAYEAAIKEGTALALGEEFDEAIYDEEIVPRAKKMDETKVFTGWDPVAAQNKIRSVGGTVEVLDSKAYVDLNDPEHKRKGHGAQAINYNTEPSKSNDRDGTKIPYFQVDDSAINEVANVRGTDERSRKVKKHGIVAYNVAIAYLLTKDQRFIRT